MTLVVQSWWVYLCPKSTCFQHAMLQPYPSYDKETPLAGANDCSAIAQIHADAVRIRATTKECCSADVSSPKAKNNLVGRSKAADNHHPSFLTTSSTHAQTWVKCSGLLMKIKAGTSKHPDDNFILMHETLAATRNNLMLSLAQYGRKCIPLE